MSALPTADDVARAVIGAARLFDLSPMVVADSRWPGEPLEKRCARVAAHALRRAFPALTWDAAVRMCGDPGCAVATLVQMPAARWWIEGGFEGAVAAIAEEIAAA